MLGNLAAFAKSIKEASVTRPASRGRCGCFWVLVHIYASHCYKIINH